MIENFLQGDYEIWKDELILDSSSRGECSKFAEEIVFKKIIPYYAQFGEVEKDINLNHSSGTYDFRDLIYCYREAIRNSNFHSDSEKLIVETMYNEKRLLAKFDDGGDYFLDPEIVKKWEIENQLNQEHY